MQRLFVCAAVVGVFVAGLLGAVALGAGQTRSATPPGWGTATIDGVLSPNEWVNAQVFQFPYSVGATSSAKLYVMNDTTSIYAAVVIATPVAGARIQFGLWFDSGDLGASNEDGFSDQANPSRLTDEHRCGASRGWCLDSRIDTKGAVSTDGRVVELSHPLNSGDAEDFQLAPGGVTTFVAFLQIADAVGSEACLPLCDLSVNSFNRFSWQRLALAAGGPPPPATSTKPSTSTRPSTSTSASAGAPTLTLGPAQRGQPRPGGKFSASVKAYWKYKNGKTKPLDWHSTSSSASCTAEVPGAGVVPASSIRRQAGGVLACDWSLPPAASGHTVTFVFAVHGRPSKTGAVQAPTRRFTQSFH